MTAGPSVPVTDLVLDFMNTVISEHGKQIDLLETDEAVLRWLEASKTPGAVEERLSHVEGIAEDARGLREVIRDLVVQRKSGQGLAIEKLNSVLAGSVFAFELVEAGEGAWVSRRKCVTSTRASVLAPVAVAAAEFLASEDFRLVKKCESEQCSVWFYDRTKAHRRRWCNMGLCGNRQKVARFRQKLREN
ncbi:hypothetical protein BTHE68_40670 [Burkholderia sp. THE68]|uniref:CGNR zinc finger domain-containing protein n=1 Tax=Burkholderia sp. THE68 TaxID=758782 RepID=UPI00131738A2|nr:ABATE domain-containing protein [Burkholderia sp. THE68]BBU30333.1 hypothetical protein BTHE68_40670 [Burkholderia sp. THE68]